MFSIIQGDIFRHKAQAIALPSDTNLNNTPGLRSLAYNYFGFQNIQYPCNNYLQKQKIDSIQYSQAITLPINHKDFKSIIHCIVPTYIEKQKEQSLSLLSKLFENIFNEIYENKIKSILIPTLGCGSAAFTIDESLMLLGDAFEKYKNKMIDVQITLVVYEKVEYEFATDFFQNILQPSTLQQKQIQIDLSQQKNQNVINQQQKQQKKMIFEEFNDDYDNHQSNDKMIQKNQQVNNQKNNLQNQKSNNKNENTKSEQVKYYNDQFQQQQIDDQFQQLKIDDQLQNEIPLKNYHKKQNIPSIKQQIISADNQSNNQYIQSNKIDQIDQFQNQQPLLKSFPPQQENKILISLYIDISVDILEMIQNQIDLLKFMLEVCQDLYKLHQKLLKNEKDLEQINNVFKYKIYYKLSENLKELQPFCPLEMQEYQYVSETHDSFAIGIIFKSIIDSKFNNEKDQQISKIKLFLQQQISETTSERPQINEIFKYLLQQLQDKSLIEDYFQTKINIQQFYSKRSNVITIQEIKKQMIVNATKYKLDQKLQQNNIIDPIVNKVSQELNINEKTEKLCQNINQQDDQFQELNIKSVSKEQNQQQQTQFKQNIQQNDCKLTLQELKLPKIDCLAIPVDKYQFKQSLPNFIKLESLDNVLEDIINLAQNDKEHFLQSVRTNVPTLGCNYILLVFCPNQNATVGRQIQLVNCFRDILLYTLKCLKLSTCFLCLDDIYNKLIVDQTDLPIDTPIKAFHEAINKHPDPLSFNEIKFNNKNWIVVKKDPLKFKLLGTSISIYKQDITAIKGIDAIVNAANNQLIKGAGVCGSIFRAAGEKQLEQEINYIFSKLKKKSIDTSEIIITNSYNLQKEQGPKFIFHAIGPIYNTQEPEKSVQQLSKCIFNILQECQINKISSIAIPIISAGIFGFPLYKCAEVFYQTILSFQFQIPMSIHIVDVLDEKIELFQIIFKGEKLREIINSKLEFAPPTDCLIGPIDLKIHNSGVVKKIIELAGPSFKNELEYKIKNYQMKDDIQYGQSFLIQGYNLKFNNIYQVLLISPPLNVNVNKSCLLYQVFLKILIETFLKKRFSSITILIYSILQQCLTNEEDLKTYDGIKAINIFLQVIQDFQQKYNQECGKITILSNVAQFCTECELIFK